MHKKIRTKIQSEIDSIKDLNSLKTTLLSTIKEFRGNQEKLGYVAGMIASDGRDKIWENIRALDDFAEQLRKANSFPIFSAVDVFSEDVYGAINLESLPDADFKIFWRDVLGSGYVTDIFMGPRWEDSEGAKDEHEFSKSAGILIHYSA